MQQQSNHRSEGLPLTHPIEQEVASNEVHALGVAHCRQVHRHPLQQGLKSSPARHTLEVWLFRVGAVNVLLDLLEGGVREDQSVPGVSKRRSALHSQE